MHYLGKAGATARDLQPSSVVVHSSDTCAMHSCFYCVRDFHDVHFSTSTIPTRLITATRLIRPNTYTIHTRLSDAL